MWVEGEREEINMLFYFLISYYNLLCFQDVCMLQSITMPH